MGQATTQEKQQWRVEQEARKAAALKRVEAGEVPRPSHGSLVCTFADCPARAEYVKSREEVLLSYDYHENLCADGCPLGGRLADYSWCAHPDRPLDRTHGCRIGRGGDPIQAIWCEGLTITGRCPNGFKR